MLVTKMKADTVDNIRERALSRRDGIYTYHGHDYYVKDHKIRMLQDENKIIAPYQHFNITLAVFDTVQQARASLKQYVKTGEEGK